MNPEAPTVTALGPTAREAAPAARVPPAGVNIRGGTEFGGLLTAEALEFIAELTRRFGARREELLAERAEFRRRLVHGSLPDFLSETAEIRRAEWTVRPPPADLRERTVEITGPVERKMIIHAMNSGARVFMADFEDAHSPTWSGTLAGQVNLIDAVRRCIDYTGPDGREYRLADHPATLMVRPRGWHLLARHFEIDGGPAPASLVDFGLFFFHNARELIARGSGPYFYLPKLEHHAEAALWADVFRHAEEKVGVALGSVRATVLIETLPAAFEMDEILYALREHSVGLNLGRWDYIFSFIKQRRDDPLAVLPDRDRMTMDTPFLSSAFRLLVRTCHRRGAQAIGGMAAQLPARDDPVVAAAAFAAVAADKAREAREGYDGTWVAHPSFVPFVEAVFAKSKRTPGDAAAAGGNSPVTAQDLLEVPPGDVTLDGLRTNVRVSLRYLEAWFRGVGAVAVDHRMEDLATVEISRAQLWQWVRHGARLNGGVVTSPLLREVLGEELTGLLSEVDGDSARREAAHHAARFLDETFLEREFPDFLSTRADRELPDGVSTGPE